MTMLQFELLLAFVTIVIFCGGGLKAFKNLYVLLVLAVGLYLAAGTFARYTNAFTDEPHWHLASLLFIFGAAALGVTFGSVLAFWVARYRAEHEPSDLFSTTSAFFATRGFDPDTGAPRPIRILTFDDSDLAD